MQFAERTGTCRRRTRVLSLSALCLAAGLAATLAPLESSAEPLKPERVLVGAVTYVEGAGAKVGGATLVGGGDPENRKTKDPLHSLYAGDAIRVTEYGKVHYRIRSGGRHAYFTTNAPHGLVVVRPSPGVVANFRSGTSFLASPDADVSKTMKAGPYTTLEMPADPVFKVVVGKRQTLLKVRQGVVVVSAQEGNRSAVVVGKNRQTTVPGGNRPTSPKVAELSNSERAELASLQEALPPVTDSKAPTPRVTGPRDPSSLRTATLTFSAAEPSVTFSCALDDNDFRLCTGAQSFDHLRPGRHTFKVRATDSVGNTGTASHSWTVDGSRIAFVSQRSGDHQIWVIDPEADSVARRLTEAGTNHAPDWSPDRTKLAFHSNRDGNWEIYVMNADGSAQRRVTSNGSTDRNPTWSPDGTRIAFQRGPGDGPFDIYSMNADGTGEARQLTTHPEDDIDPAWSPGGIAFASRRDASTYEIYIMNPDGSGQRRLTDNAAQDFGPAWSPIGGKLAFHTDRVRDDNTRRGPSHIYLMNPDSSGQSPLTTTGADDFNPAWAPDGQVLVFHRHYPVGGDEIWIINADGSSEIRLTNGEDDTVPDW